MGSKPATSSAALDIRAGRGTLIVRSLLFPQTPSNDVLFWLEAARVPLGVLGFGLTAVFYIRWNDRWFRQHADQEFRLQRCC